MRRFLDQYIFQMRISDVGVQSGWITPDEEIDDLDQYTPYFTIPWFPALETTLESPDYMLVGKRGDKCSGIPF